VSVSIFSYPIPCHDPVLSRTRSVSFIDVFFWVQGLRAFLPLAEFIKYPNAAKGESYESYVSGFRVSPILTL